MDRIDRSGTGIASLGRDEDQFLAHVALGERVVPPVISASTQARINQEMRAAGLDPNEYAVGSGMSINPITGLPEFGFFKKAFKSIKKVAKKVAPVIGPLANFIPGVGPLMSAAIQAGTTKLAGGSFGDALKAGVMSYGVGKLGQGIGSLGKGAEAAKTSGNLFSKIKSGIGSIFNPAEGAKGIFGGSIGPSLRRGIGGLFGGMGGGASASEYTPMSDTMDGPITGYMDANGNVISVGQYNQIMSSKPQFSGLFGPDSIADKLFNVDPNKGTGPLSFLTGSGNQGTGLNPFGGGGMGGLGSLGLAGFLGKMAYDSAKKKEGGISETPKVTMDQLGRYQLSKELGTGGTRGEFGLGPKPAVLNVAGGGEARQYFNEGGLAAVQELDMRDGGESEGPGTGTSDDIPAMLSDGEFVMTAAATQGAGAFNVNKTKSGIELVSGGSASREKGVENMRELMNIFEAV